MQKIVIHIVILVLMLGCKIDEDIRYPADSLDCSHERSFSSMTVNGDVAMTVEERQNLFKFYFENKVRMVFGASSESTGLNYGIDIIFDTYRLNIGKYDCLEIVEASLAYFPGISYYLDCDSPHFFEFEEVFSTGGRVCFTFEGTFREKESDGSGFKQDGKVFVVENGKFLQR